MKITFETDYNSCQVQDNNVENVSETVDLMVQCLRGFGFADSSIAETLLQKSKEINSDKIVLVV